MQPSEAAVLLAKVAAFDRRTVGEADAHAWAEVLTTADVSLSDALDAVTAHFGQSSDWLMPKHVIDRVQEVHRKRHNAAGFPDYPSGLDRATERSWARVWLREVEAGATPDEACRTADARFRIERPELVARPVAELLAKGFQR